MGRTPSLFPLSILLAIGCAAGPSPGPAPTPSGPADAGAPETAAPAEPADAGPPSYQVIGSWAGRVQAGILEGTTMVLTFYDNGRARGIADWVTLESEWEARGDVVEINDLRATPALAACPADEVGRYIVEFEPSCEAVRVVSGEDPCRHRRLALIGLRGTRQ